MPRPWDLKMSVYPFLRGLIIFLPCVLFHSREALAYPEARPTAGGAISTSVERETSASSSPDAALVPSPAPTLKDSSHLRGEGRFYARLRPYATFLSPYKPPPPALTSNMSIQTYGAVALDLGFDYRADDGFWIGAGLASLNAGGDPPGTFSAHVFFGYARQKFGIAFALGGGYYQPSEGEFPAWVITAFQFGVALRAGSLSGTHALFRGTFSWITALAPQYNSSELALNILLKQRWWLHLNGGWDAALNFRLYGTAGAQYALSAEGGRAKDLLLGSLGAIAGLLPDFPTSKKEYVDKYFYSPTDIGLLVTLGYERRW